MNYNNKKLNKDCLLMIFEELQDEPNSLYYLLQVCKDWLYSVVPILWRDPWKFLCSEREKKILNTIFSLLSEDSKKYLKSQGVDLHHENYEKPFIDYIQFIKYIKWKLDINTMWDAGSRIYHHDKFKQEIYKLFISKCSSIKYLDITGVKQQLHKFSEAKTSLSTLCELHCSSADSPSLFRGLAKICTSIKKLGIIFNENPNPGLDELIEKQETLKSIKISVNEDMLYSHQLENKYLHVIQAIIKLSDKLEYIEIPIEIMQSTFPKLNKLRKLFLDGQLMYNEDSLDFSTYPNIETLYLNRVLISTAEKAIMNTTNLQIIWMDNIYFSGDQDQSRNFIQIISQHCPNLKYIKVLLKDQYLEELQQLLANCHGLEGLYIDADPQESNCRGDELLDILIKSINSDQISSLFKIQINDFKFKTEKFDSLFTNWKDRTLRSLWLYSRNIIVDPEDDFKRLIKNYKAKKVINKYETDKELNFIDDHKEFEQKIIN